MQVLGYIILFTFLGSIVSLIGGILLLLKEKFTIKISHFLASFAAGTLLGVSFFDLLPEALHEGEPLGIPIFLWTLVGILFFFLMERFIHWFHHHHVGHEEDNTKPTVPLIVFGDSVHNFIDGVAIAATFMVSIPLGIATTIAVAAHEIPQEIGDFGILLHRGVKRGRVLLYNVISAFTALVGAVLAFYIGDSIEGFVPILLSLSAGFFIYIALSDLIPEIHHEKRRGFAFWETTLLFAGVAVIYLFVTLLPHVE